MVSQLQVSPCVSVNCQKLAQQKGTPTAKILDNDSCGIDIESLPTSDAMAVALARGTLPDKTIITYLNIMNTTPTGGSHINDPHASKFISLRAFNCHDQLIQRINNQLVRSIPNWFDDSQLRYQRWLLLPNILLHHCYCPSASSLEQWSLDHVTVSHGSSSSLPQNSQLDPQMRITVFGICALTFTWTRADSLNGHNAQRKKKTKAKFNLPRN